MEALAIVEDLEVVEQRRPGLVASAVTSLVDVLDLERGEQAFHGRVVEAIAFAAHGLRDAMPLQHCPVGLGSVLPGFKRRTALGARSRESSTASKSYVGMQRRAMYRGIR